MADAAGIGEAEGKAEGGQSGTQSIERAILIIRALASSNFVEGMRFTELCGVTGLNKGTLYRILRTLRREGFVEQHQTTRLYHLGMDFLALGSVATNRFNIRELANPCLSRLAAYSEDTVFLSMRSGSDAVCVDRLEGSFPIKALTLNVGSRRPLGVGAGALALLAWLPDEEIADIVGRNARKFSHNRRFSPGIFLDWVAKSQAQGYAFNDGQFLGGMCAIGVPVMDSAGRPVAALSIAAISDRMAEPRRAELAGRLKTEAARLAEDLYARGA